MTIYSLDVLLFRFGTSLLFHAQFSSNLTASEYSTPFKSSAKHRAECSLFLCDFCLLLLEQHSRTLQNKCPWLGTLCSRSSCPGLSSDEDHLLGTFALSWRPVNCLMAWELGPRLSIHITSWISPTASILVIIPGERQGPITVHDIKNISAWGGQLSQNIKPKTRHNRESALNITGAQ